MDRRNYLKQLIDRSEKRNIELNVLIPIMFDMMEDEEKEASLRRSTPEEKTEIRAFAATLNGELTSELTGRDLIAKAIEAGVNVRMNQGAIITAGKEIKSQLRIRDQSQAAALIRPKK